MSHHIVTLFDSLVTMFDLATLVRLADSPSRCQAAIDGELNPYEFYADHEWAIQELAERQAGLLGLDLDDFIGNDVPTEGQRQKSLALWAIHQAACELAASDDAVGIQEFFQGRVPAGIHLVPISA